MAARRPAAIPITYRHRARGRPACCCARPCPWRDSPNRPTPESPRCPTPDAACARSNRHSPNSRPCPIRRRWTTRRRGRRHHPAIPMAAHGCMCAPSGCRAISTSTPTRCETQLADLNGSEQDLTGLPDQGLSARAHLSSAAEIRDGVVDIAVQEGVYDEIQLDNRSRVSDAVLRRGLSVLRPGDPVHIDNLESRLLRLSDLPGAAVQGTLRAGAHPGSSTLLVNAAPTPLVTGSIDADNFGGLLHRRIPPGRQPGREQPAAPGRPTQPAPANQRPQAALLRRLPGAGRPPSPAWA